MRGNRRADNGKEIRFNFVSLQLSRQRTTLQESRQREVKDGGRRNKEGLKGHKKQNEFFGKRGRRMEKENFKSQGCLGVGFTSAL